MESALSPIRSGLRRLRYSASFQTLSSLAGPKKEATPLDWWCVFALQACSMISILSTTYIFSTAVFMVRVWGATDEAKAAAHAGLMIATKPAFSALSSYVWGSLGDKVGFQSRCSRPPRSPSRSPPRWARWTASTGRWSSAPSAVSSTGS